jgi:SAM-dependent methyltransferase
MNQSKSVRHVLLALTLSLLTVNLFAQAQQADKQFEPTVGQAGKDVVWVPTPQALVDKMLDMARVTPQDFVMDLGSGDGRTVITAAKRGARAAGIEYNPDMVALSKKNAASQGLNDRATFAEADLFQTDLSKANVITMFLLPDINLRLRPKILDLKPGTRVVSNTFTMGEWEADRTETITECTSWCTALLWIVPAKVDGTWQLQQGELKLTQTFQNVAGTLGNTAITNGKLNGDQIAFSVGGTQYTGRVNGTTMEGTFKSGSGSGNWRATKR